jgi:hypothetical protein
MPMPTLTTLASGLSGAIGSHFNPGNNRLFLVEWGGKLSVYNFTRAVQSMALNGVTKTLHGTFSLDLDTGAEGTTGQSDIWWNQLTAVTRRMEPTNGAQIAYLGVMTATAFDALGAAQLQALTYSTTAIVGNNDATNQLVANAVFAVRTSQGYYSKVQVKTYGYDLILKVSTYRLQSAYQVLGTGYVQPEDVKVNAAGTVAYITERGGQILRVALNSATPPNRSAASVLCAGLTAPHQMSLHEDRGLLYAVEFAALGRLVRVDLGSGAVTPLGFNLDHAIGLAVSADHEYAYVSEQASAGGRVRRIRIASGVAENVVTGLTSPFMLNFLDSSANLLVVTERDPANRISLLDLSATPVVRTDLITGTPTRPSSAIAGPYGQLLICSDTVLSSAPLVVVPSAGTGPLLIGVGHVPIDRITDGYANTIGAAGCYFQVRDCPFGGSLQLMFNHERARLMGALYYQVLVDGAPVMATLSDYRWNNATSHFDVVTAAPTALGLLPVRAPGELWFTPYLGFNLNTAALAQGLHAVTVKLFASTAAASEVSTLGVPYTQTQLMIDNTVPSARINSIFRDNVPVGACAIVEGTSDQFTFDLTASDPEQHLLSWNLYTVWGNSQSKGVASDHYNNHISGTKRWAGLPGNTPGSTVPVMPATWHATVTTDATSRRCAHTFVLEVWDRVIDGHGYIHPNSATYSVTLMLS